MKKQKSLKLNFIMNAMLTMSSFIFPLITFPYVSRILLAEGTGKVQFATSFISYFTMFSQLGVPTYGIRAVAGVRDDKEQLSRTVQELFILRLATTTISYTAFFILLATVPRLQGEKLLYVIMSANTFLTFIGMEWLYKGLEHYTYITIRQITVKFLSLILMFLLVRQKSDYIIYGAIAVFAGAASNIFNFIHARRYIYFRPMGNWNVRRHIRPVMVFFALSCATMIYTHLDTVMLGFMKTDTDVGYYGAAVKIKTLLVSIVTSLGTVLLPRASYYVKKGDMEKFRAITSKALRFVMLMATPLVIYFMLFASSGIRLLSGSGFDGAIVPMILIMPTLLFIGMSNITGLQILVPTGREKLVLYSTIAGAVLDVIINAALIHGIQKVPAGPGPGGTGFDMDAADHLCGRHFGRFPETAGLGDPFLRRISGLPAGHQRSAGSGYRVHDAGKPEKTIFQTARLNPCLYRLLHWAGSRQSYFCREMIPDRILAYYFTD